MDPAARRGSPTANRDRSSLDRRDRPDETGQLHLRQSTAAAERAAEASERQTEIQEALSRRTAEPSLWVDIRPDDQSGQLLTLVIGNSGPTIATNVVVTFDPPLRDTAFESEAVRRGEERLNAGLASLPPGRVLSWYVGVAHGVFSNPAVPMSYSVTINASGPFGPIEPLVYTIDLGDMRKTLVPSVTPGTGQRAEAPQIDSVTIASADIGTTTHPVGDGAPRPRGARSTSGCSVLGQGGRAGLPRLNGWGRPILCIGGGSWGGRAGRAVGRRDGASRLVGGPGTGADHRARQRDGRQ